MCGTYVAEWLMVDLGNDLAISSQVYKESVIEFGLLPDKDLKADCDLRVLLCLFDQVTIKSKQIADYNFSWLPYIQTALVAWQDVNVGQSDEIKVGLIIHW